MSLRLRKMVEPRDAEGSVPPAYLYNCILTDKTAYCLSNFNHLFITNPVTHYYLSIDIQIEEEYYSESYPCAQAAAFPFLSLTRKKAALVPRAAFVEISIDSWIVCAILSL